MLIIHTLKFVRLLKIIHFAIGKSWIRQNNTIPIYIKGSDPIHGFEHTFAVTIVKIKKIKSILIYMISYFNWELYFIFHLYVQSLQ